MLLLFGKTGPEGGGVSFKFKQFMVNVSNPIHRPSNQAGKKIIYKPLNKHSLQGEKKHLLLTTKRRDRGKEERIYLSRMTGS